MPKEHGPPPLLRAAVSVLVRGRFIVAGAWLVLVCLGVWLGPRFLSHTSLTIDAPSSAPSTKAQNLFEESFPASVIVAVLLTRENGSSVMAADTEHFVRELNSTLVAHSPDKVYGVLSFYTFQDMGLGLVGDMEFIKSSDEGVPMATWLAVSLAANPPSSFVTFFHNTLAHLEAKWFPPQSHMSVLATGEPLFVKALNDGTEHDMLIMDGVSLPLALFIVGLAVGAVRLLVFPIINVAVSLSVAFTILYFIAAYATTIVSIAPSLVMSLIVALSIDYSLFLLSRWNEEIRNGRSDVDAVLYMVWGAGHVICVSGGTLSVVFLGLLLFPLNLISSLGLSAALTVITIIIVNLTLTPALLSIFPNFFRRGVGPWPTLTEMLHCACLRRKQDAFYLPAQGPTSKPLQPYSRSSVNTSNGDATTFTNPSNDDAADDDDDKLLDPSDDAPLLGAQGDFEDLQDLGPSPTRTLLQLRDTRWYRFMTKLLRWPWPPLVLVAIVALVVPLAMNCYKFNQSIHLQLFLPRNADASICLDDMETYFGPGQVTPYYLVLKPRAGSPGVYTEAFFHQAAALAEDLVDMDRTALHAGSFDSIFYTALGPTNFTIFEDCLHKCKTVTACSDWICKLYRYSAENLVAPDGSSTYAAVTLNVDPFTQAGTEWLKRARRLLDHSPAQQTMEIGLAGGAGPSYDGIQAVYRDFPLAISVTAGVVLLLVGAAYRSVVVPLRSLFTLAISLVVVYGSGFFIYEKGRLDGLGFAGLHSSPDHGLSWLVPVLCFSLAAGLGLDYDIFVLSRVYELRSSGYSELQALLLGATSTFRIVSSAGVIMALALGALLFSSIPSLAQISCYLTIAVVVDTFLVRSIVLPCLMWCLGKYNWWPSKPATTRSDLS